MAVITDHIKNLQRIADTLMADTSVFDGGVTAGKARSIKIYDPNSMVKKSEHMPYIYVTTRDSLQSSRRDLGVTSSESINANNVEYEIVIVAKSNAFTRSSQSQVYDILKNTRKSLEANPKFPDDSDEDPIFTRSVVSEPLWDPETRGKLVTSVSVILLATIGNDFQIEFPDSGLTIDVRSEVRNKGRNSTKISSVSGDTKTSDGAYVGTLIYEYDYDSVVFAQVDSLIEAGMEINLNLIDGGTVTGVTVKPVFQNITMPTIDAIRTVMLTLEESTV